MSPTEKILEFMREHRLNQAAFSDLSKIGESHLTRIKKGDYSVTIDVGIKAAKAMGVTLDWLFDDAQGWPPPAPDDRVTLTPAQKRILELAQEVSEDDPDPSLLKEAKRRLLRSESRPAGEQYPGERPLEPGGPSYGDVKGTKGKMPPNQTPYRKTN